MAVVFSPNPATAASQRDVYKRALLGNGEAGVALFDLLNIYNDPAFDFARTGLPEEQEIDEMSAPFFDYSASAGPQPALQDEPHGLAKLRRQKQLFDYLRADAAGLKPRQQAKRIQRKAEAARALTEQQHRFAGNILSADRILERGMLVAQQAASVERIKNDLTAINHSLASTKRFGRGRLEQRRDSLQQQLNLVLQPHGSYSAQLLHERTDEGMLAQLDALESAAANQGVAASERERFVAAKDAAGKRNIFQRAFELSSTHVRRMDGTERIIAMAEENPEKAMALLEHPAMQGALEVVFSREESEAAIAAQAKGEVLRMRDQLEARAMDVARNGGKNFNPMKRGTIRQGFHTGVERIASGLPLVKGSRWLMRQQAKNLAVRDARLLNPQIQDQLEVIREAGYNQGVARHTRERIEPGLGQIIQHAVDDGYPISNLPPYAQQLVQDSPGVGAAQEAARQHAANVGRAHGQAAQGPQRSAGFGI